MTLIEQQHFKKLIDNVIAAVPKDELDEVIQHCKHERESRNTGSKKDKMGMSKKGESRIALGLPPTMAAYMEGIPALKYFFNPKGEKAQETAKERLYWFAREYPQFTKSHFTGRN